LHASCRTHTEVILKRAACYPINENESESENEQLMRSRYLNTSNITQDGDANLIGVNYEHQASEVRALSGEIPYAGSPRGNFARPAQSFGSHAPTPKLKPRRLNLARPYAAAPASLRHSSSRSCRILRRVIFAVPIGVAAHWRSTADGTFSVAHSDSSRLPVL
jgi:hypothetical protein